MIFIFSGCIRDVGKSSTTGSNLSTENSISQANGSKVNGSASTNAASSANKNGKSSTGASTNYDDIQKQLDELEDVLNSLDSYSEADLGVPTP